MNITQESEGFAALMAAANKLNSELEVKPQVCNLEDDECLSCGS